MEAVVMATDDYESIAERVLRQYMAKVTHLDDNHGVRIQLEPIASHVIFDGPIWLLSPVQQLAVADEIAANLASKLKELIFDRDRATPVNLGAVKRERGGKTKFSSDPSS
jgi:hypothetical protein